MGKNKFVEEKRRRKTELQRLRRMKIRSDPEKYERIKAEERERWKKRKQHGKIKSINDLSRRDRKVKRSLWAESSRKYREKRKLQKIEERRFIEETTPPPSPRNVNGAPSTSRHNVGRRRVRRDRAKAYRTISKLRETLKSYKKQSSKYKSKYFRLKRQLKQNGDSPNTKVSTLLKNCQVPQEVRKKLLLHEVLTRQILDNLTTVKKRKDRLQARGLLSGKIVKKYRLLGKISFLSYKEQRNVKVKKLGRKKLIQLAKKVQSFLQRDDSSRLCPGKNDTITKRGVKKQKRLLNKPLKYLHKDFMIETNCVISYSLFCQLRPFWVVYPNLNKRDTCLCTTCENMELLIKKMKIVDLLNSSSSEILFKSISCEEVTELCLERKCPDCAHKKIVFNEHTPEDEVMYWQWLSKGEIVLVSGKEKLCKKVVKTKVKCTKKEMITALTSTFEKFMQHIANKNHQFQALDSLKQSLNEGEILLQIDFSENYVCKYNREIQSMHFGGSKQQAVLHTSVAYFKLDGKIVHQSFCTISESPRKDPLAILSHLKPVFNYLVSLVPSLIKMHFLSDGPSTQYRNFKMFHLFGVEFPNILPNTVNSLTWNYSEKGHGKGAPDGIGGCLKRLADNLVASGGDVSNVSDLVEELRKITKKVKIIHVPAQDIDNLDITLPNKITRFKGTLNTHQITWCKNHSHLHFRRLSCNVCPEFEVCQHYKIGTLLLENKLQNNPLGYSRLNYSDVYSSSSSSSEDDENVPLSSYVKKKIENINEGDYVVVKFVGKKNFKYYIGFVIKTISAESFEVKFLRKSNNSCFIFPSVDDIAIVDRSDVEIKLETPQIAKRGHHIFKKSLINKYKYYLS